MNVLVFDIETIPDVDAGRRLYKIADLTDQEVGRVMFHKRREQTGDSEFLRLHLHRIVLPMLSKQSEMEKRSIQKTIEERLKPYLI